MIDLTLLASAMLISGAAATADAEFTVAQPEEKMICRKREETGSLIRRTRVCHTRAEWKRLSELAEREVDDFRISRNGVNNFEPPEDIINGGLPSPN